MEHAAAVVGPEFPARFGVQRIDGRAHERPDARGEVHATVGDDRPASDRPHGAQVFVRQQPGLLQPGEELPLQASVSQCKGVKMAVVRGNEYASVTNSRCKSDGSVRPKAPAFRSGVGVQRSQ